jgi:hypothetical protein
MIQQTTFLLRSIWEIAPWRDDLLATFERWIQEGTSRREVKSKVKALIQTRLPEQTAFSDSVDLEQVNWDHLIELLCTCFYRKRSRNIPFSPWNTAFCR